MLMIAFLGINVVVIVMLVSVMGKLDELTKAVRRLAPREAPAPKPAEIAEETGA